MSLKCFFLSCSCCCPLVIFLWLLNFGFGCYEYWCCALDFSHLISKHSRTINTLKHTPRDKNKFMQPNQAAEFKSSTFNLYFNHFALNIITIYFEDFTSATLKFEEMFRCVFTLRNACEFLNWYAECDCKRHERHIRMLSKDWLNCANEQEKIHYLLYWMWLVFGRSGGIMNTQTQTDIQINNSWTHSDIHRCSSSSRNWIQSM